jgi:hypothetical protein
MSPEREQEIIQRLRDDHSKAAREATLLRGELESIGASLVEMGRSLIQDPTLSVVAPMDGDAWAEAINVRVERLKAVETTVRRAKMRLQDVGVFVE